MSQHRQGLVVDNLGFRFGAVPLFEDVSFTVDEGEVLCLLGPSGCGKTTILRLVAGLELVQTGSISISGLLMAGGGVHVPPEQRNIGLVLQDFALFPHMTVADNIAFGLRQRRVDLPGRVDELLELVRLTGHKEKYPHMLSGGEQQRVALARALAVEPDLMLMDEPFSGLDPQHRNRVRDETLIILKELAIPTLLVTHDPEEAMRLGDRIALMKSGGLAQTGTPAELYHTPAEPEVVPLFGEPNRCLGIVAGGSVETPFGGVPAKGLAEGAGAQVLVRPRAFSIAGEEAQAVKAHVVMTRFLGGDWLVHFSVEGAETVFEARVQSKVPLAPQTELLLVLDPAKAYVFAEP